MCNDARFDNPNTKRSKSNDKMFLLLCSLTALDTISWSLAYPTYTSLQRELNMSLQESQWLTSFLCTITFISTPLIGYICNITSHKMCLLLSCTGALFGHLLIYFAKTQEQYIIGRIIPSFFKCFAPMAQAYTSDITDKSEIVSRLGRLMAFNNAAWMIGPFLGGLIANHIGTRFPWCIAAIGHGFNLVSMMFVLPTTNKKIIKYKIDESTTTPTTTTTPTRSSARLKAKEETKESIQDDNDNDVDENKDDGNYSLFYFIVMLHIKFMFSFGNCLYETLHGQSLTASPPIGLGESSGFYGWVLALIGIINTFTNAYLLSLLAKYFSKSNNGWQLLLAIASLGQAGASIMWGSSTSLIKFVIVSCIIAITNTLFANLVTGKISESITGKMSGTSLLLLSNVDRAARITAAPLGGWLVRQGGKDDIGFQWPGIGAGICCGYTGFFLIGWYYWKRYDMKTSFKVKKD